MWTRVAIVAVFACDKGAPPPAPTIEPTEALAGWDCEAMPFASATPVPEASGAAWMDIDGKRVLVVAADSGNHGAYGLVDPVTGATIEQGQLPLGGSTDDLEGLDARDGKLYGLTSPGWILVWRRVGSAFELVDGPYPLGPVDLPPTGGVGDKPPPGDGMVCDGKRTNCGRNFEGLCLSPRIPGRGLNPLLCTGFAASKADGHLYCLTELNEPHDLAIDRKRAIAIDRPGVVADCAFVEDSLWVADNLFGLSQVYRVDGWRDPDHARVVPTVQLGVGFSEVIAGVHDRADDGRMAGAGATVYRMSDTGGAPSSMAKFHCRARTR